MNESEKRSLMKNRTDLLDNLNPKDVLDYLQEEGVLNTDDQERILEEKTRKDKATALLNMLPYRGSKAYQVFRDAMKGEYRWLADKLDEAHNCFQPGTREIKKEPIKDLKHRVLKKVSEHPEVLRDWGNLGRCLGLDETDIVALNYANQSNIKEASYQMLMTWKSCQGSKATPTSLISGLRECGFNDLADELEGK